MNKFWNWVRNEDTGERSLYLEGVIAQESWFGDDLPHNPDTATMRSILPGQTAGILRPGAGACNPVRVLPCF